MFIPDQKIDDLVEMAKLPNADMESLIKIAAQRGVEAGKEAKKLEIIELIETA